MDDAPGYAPPDMVLFDAAAGDDMDTAGIPDTGGTSDDCPGRSGYGATCSCEFPMNGGMNAGRVMYVPSVPV
jgi:hypothetical protein